jgi:hypothetical protein
MYCGTTPKEASRSLYCDNPSIIPVKFPSTPRHGSDLAAKNIVVRKPEETIMPA